MQQPEDFPKFLNVKITHNFPIQIKKDVLCV